MARSDVRDSVKHAVDTAVERGREAQEVGKKRAAELQEVGKKRAAELQKEGKKRAAELQKEGKKRAAKLQKDAAKQTRKSAKKARKNANKKAQEWVELAAEKTGRKKKRSKGRLLAILGGGALAAYAVVTFRKKQAEQDLAAEPGAPTAR